MAETAAEIRIKIGKLERLRDSTTFDGERAACQGRIDRLKAKLPPEVAPAEQMRRARERVNRQWSEATRQKPKANPFRTTLSEAAGHARVDIHPPAQGALWASRLLGELLQVEKWLFPKDLEMAEKFMIQLTRARRLSPKQWAWLADIVERGVKARARCPQRD